MKSVAFQVKNSWRKPFKRALDLLTALKRLFPTMQGVLLRAVGHRVSDFARSMITSSDLLRSETSETSAPKPFRPWF